ncbi:hypothetical protein MJG53_016852 [Ovis ammon polii x Ovis aries]|uniref:Uncharacterized protein n=1 Tax=Ovis ammon polii x Ovis aries TaxID=2918886 RepID=A0ACB9U9Y7_9CETA|nr:hypothetical protein MJG53_016852 [Ovis ammon polii x Ovis aries]
MAFNDLLLQVGGVGRFQKIQLILLTLPLLLTFLHNTLQNFTAAIPTHHCRPPANTNLSKDGDLEAWLPRDRQGQPESCLLFTSPQRGPPFPNGTETNGTGATEPCPHGWIYDNSTFPSTIVTELCTLLSKFDSTPGTININLAVVLLFKTTGSVIRSSNFFVDSLPSGAKNLGQDGKKDCVTQGAGSPYVPVPIQHTQPTGKDGVDCGGASLALLDSGSSFLTVGPCVYTQDFGAVESVHLHGRDTGRKLDVWDHGRQGCSEPGNPIDANLSSFPEYLSQPILTYLGLSWNLEWLPIHARPSLGLLLGFVPTLGQLSLAGMAYALPHWRHLQLLVSLPFFVTFIYSRFVLLFSLYGVVMSLQSFEINIYLAQVFFTIVDPPFYFLGFLATKSLGRKRTQTASVLLSGVFIVTCAMIPLDRIFLRITMAVIGKGCLIGSMNCLFMYMGELYPTVMRQRGVNVTNCLANIGSILSPLVGMTSDLYPSLPLFIYGGVLVAACPITAPLPETLGLPLPNTLQDLERRWKEKSGQKQQEQQMVPLQSS